MLASDDVVSCQVGNPRTFLPKIKTKSKQATTTTLQQQKKNIKKGK